MWEPLKKGIVTDADVAANGGGEAEASSLAHSWDGAASRGVERRDAHLLMTTDNAPIISGRSDVTKFDFQMVHRLNILKNVHILVEF